MVRLPMACVLCLVSGLAVGTAAAQPFGAEATAQTHSLSDSDSGPHSASAEVTDFLFGAYHGAASSDLPSGFLGAYASAVTNFTGAGHSEAVARYTDTLAVTSDIYPDGTPVPVTLSLALDGTLQASFAFPILDAYVELSVEDLTGGTMLFHARGGYIGNVFVAEGGFEVGDFDLENTVVIENATLSGWTGDAPLTWIVGESYTLQFELRAWAATCPCAGILAEADFADGFAEQVLTTDPDVTIVRASAVPEPSLLGLLAVGPALLALRRARRPR
jgi:hypothetical protein